MASKATWQSYVYVIASIAWPSQEKEEMDCGVIASLRGNLF